MQDMKGILLWLMALLVPLAGSAYTLKRVSVHDPSIVWEPASQTYYIFGSHRAAAKSKDLMSCHDDDGLPSLHLRGQQPPQGCKEFGGVQLHVSWPSWRFALPYDYKDVVGQDGPGCNQA